jgi:hypothetical protein
MGSHKEQVSSLFNIKGTYICDVEQNIGWAYAGPWFPCLVTHGKLGSLRKNVFFTAKEHLLVMGEAVYPAAHMAGGRCLFQEFLDGGSLKDNDVKKIAGQAMHLNYLTPFMLYGVANLQRKKEGVAMLLP